MKPYLQDADVTLYCGGALETLRKLEAGSVDCCVTSPPFWALRDYCILAGCPEGGTVLDPFAGSGTTGLVARKHGRRAVLIELSEAYCQLTARRLAQQSLLAEATT